MMFFDLGDQPFANSLLESRDTAEDWYPLQLAWCPSCKLVQLNHTADPAMLFSRYVWVTGTSTTAVAHADHFCHETLERVDRSALSYVAELASNDGTFLRPFLQRAIPIMGVDPAKNIAERANATSIPTRCGFFGERLATEIVRDRGEAGLVIARNVVPHVANLHDFMGGIDILLGDEGLVVLELHYGGVILNELHYDSIYHEHLCYFTLQSVSTLLGRYGMTIVDIGRSPISGGSVILYIRRKGAQPTAIARDAIEKEERMTINDLQSWQNFADRSAFHASELRTFLAGQGCVAAYGASARSSTLLNYATITSEMISRVADKNKMKQGKFTAGTRIPIVSPGEMLATAPEAVLVLAWNFFDEISHDLRKNYGYQGRLVKPLPNKTTIEEGKGS